MFTVKLFNNEKQIKSKEFEDLEDAKDFAHDYLGDAADYFEISDSETGEVIDKEEMRIDDDLDFDMDDFGQEGFDEFDA